MFAASQSGIRIVRCLSHTGGNFAQFSECRVHAGIPVNVSSSSNRIVHLHRILYFIPTKLPMRQLVLEQLEYKGQAVDMGANWGGNLESDSQPMSLSLRLHLPQPDWLKQAAAPPASSSDEEAASASQSPEPIPDFLRQAGWGESSGAFQESQASTSPATADETEAAPAVQADLPDWVKAMAPKLQRKLPLATPANAPVPPPMDVPGWFAGPWIRVNPPLRLRLRNASIHSAIE